MSNKSTIKELCARGGLLIIAIAMALFLSEIFVRFFVPVGFVGPILTEWDSYYGNKLKKNFSCSYLGSEFTMHIGLRPSV